MKKINSKVQIVILFTVIAILFIATAIVLGMTLSILTSGITISDLRGAWPNFR